MQLLMEEEKEEGKLSGVFYSDDLTRINGASPKEEVD